MYKPSMPFKILMAISLVLLILIFAVGVSFRSGERHGYLDGRLYELPLCLMSMNKLAKTLTDPIICIYPIEGKND